MKRLLIAASVFVALAGLYLVSYRFSGITVSSSDPTLARLNVLGVSLPPTPAVLSIYNTFYWPLRLQTARQMPAKTVTGEIRAIDFSQRQLIVASAPGQNIGCAFTPSHDETLQSLKRGDMVTASIGYVPDPKHPTSWSYNLLSIAFTR
jgi:hypothetical protein